MKDLFRLHHVPRFALDEVNKINLLVAFETTHHRVEKLWVAHHFVQTTNGCRHFIFSLFSIFGLRFRRMLIDIYYMCHLYCLKPAYMVFISAVSPGVDNFGSPQIKSRAASFPFHLYMNTLKSIPHFSLIERPERGRLLITSK